MPARAPGSLKRERGSAPDDREGGGVTSPPDGVPTRGAVFYRVFVVVFIFMVVVDLS